MKKRIVKRWVSTYLLSYGERGHLSVTCLAQWSAGVWLGAAQTEAAKV